MNHWLNNHRRGEISIKTSAKNCGRTSVANGSRRGRLTHPPRPQWMGQPSQEWCHHIIQRGQCDKLWAGPRRPILASGPERKSAPALPCGSRTAVHYVGWPSVTHFCTATPRSEISFQEFENWGRRWVSGYPPGWVFSFSLPPLSGWRHWFE